MSSPKHVGEIHLPAMCHSPVSEKPAVLVASLQLSLGQIGIYIYIYLPAVIRSSYCSSIVTPLRPVPLGKKQTAQIILLYIVWVFFCGPVWKLTRARTWIFFTPYMNVKIYVWNRCLSLSSSALLEICSSTFMQPQLLLWLSFLLHDRYSYLTEPPITLILILLCIMHGPIFSRVHLIRLINLRCPYS